MTPPTPAQVATLMALVRVYERDGRATVRAVAAEAGRPLNATHSALVALRDRGFVTWESGKTGTLRPLLEEVGL